MAVALPGSITGSGFGSARRWHSDGNAGQRPSATMRTTRANLPLRNQDHSRCVLARRGEATHGRLPLAAFGSYIHVYTVHKGLLCVLECIKLMRLPVKFFVVTLPP